MILPRRKKLLPVFLSALLLAGAVFWIGTPHAHAAGTVADSLKSLGSKALAGVSDVGMGLAIAYIALYLVFEVASYIIAFAGLFLDVLFGANIILTPGSNPVVLAGWTALRDLSNGLFILVILWIAVAIIFDLESWGSRRLLVRVIVVGLLINFSLLMATTVFAFANQLALPFARAMKLDPYNPDDSKVTLSTMFIRETKVHSVATIIRDQGVPDQFKKSVQGATVLAPSEKNNLAGPASLWAATVPQSLGAGPVVPSAQADVPTGVAAGWGCLKAAGLLTAVTGNVKVVGMCAVVGLAAGAFVNTSQVMSAAGPVVASVAGWVLGPYINLAIADLILLITASAFFSAAVLLAVRYIAMIFIGVFAPIAFLGLVIPRYGERIWNMWLDNLFRWAFVAPIFYFLLYLSVYMLQAISSAQSSFAGSDNIPFQGNALQIFSLVIFLVFLWASIFLTRKAAGMGAEAALTFSKRVAGVGLGLGGGLAMRKALPLIGRLATGVQEQINQGSPLMRSTFGRGLTAFGLGQVTRASRKQLSDRQTQINSQGWTSAEIQQRLASGYFKTDTDVAAAIGVLKSRGDLDVQAGVQGYGATHLEKAASVYRGLKTDLVPLMRANPTIAKQADFAATEFETTNPRSAINEVLGADGRSGATPTTNDYEEATKLLAWRRLRPQDVDTFDLDILADDANKRRFLQVARGDHLSHLGRRDPRRATQMQTYLDNPANRDLWDSFTPEKQKYFTSSAAGAIGVWHVPPYARAVKGDKTLRALQPVVGVNVPTGLPYTSPRLVVGGTAPFTATIRNGAALPPGLAFNATTGEIIGSTSAAPGSTFAVDYEITDSDTPPATERVSIHITIE